MWHFKIFLSGSDFAPPPPHHILPHSQKLGGLKKKFMVALILFLYKPCSEPSQENVGLFVFLTVWPDAFSP